MIQATACVNNDFLTVGTDLSVNQAIAMAIGVRFWWVLTGLGVIGQWEAIRRPVGPLLALLLLCIVPVSIPGYPAGTSLVS